MSVKYINTQRDLKRAMRRANLKRQDVAAALGITPQAVWKWLKGLSPVPRYAGMWFYHEHGITKSDVANKK